MKTAIFLHGASARTTSEAVSREDNVYDAVVVGGGISGAIIAGELGRQGKRVLILEAGPGGDRTWAGYQAYLTHYFATAYKDNQAPYPQNLSAPMPRSSEARKITPGITDSSGYLVQTGPFSTDTTYTRVLGGTTMHWEGKTPRMLPEDFELGTRFEQGVDWPLNYEQLEPFYQRAEKEIGVSADVEDQAFLGIDFKPGYV